MPHKPYWFRNIATIRRWLEAIQEPVLDRRAVEAVFGVSAREANRILRRAGCWRLGGATVALRSSLAQWVAREVPAAEEDGYRREKLEKALEAARADLAGRRVRIQPIPVEDPTIAGLPAGVQLSEGRLVIEFFGFEDLMSHLQAVARAAMNDTDRFREAVEDLRPKERHRKES